MEMGTLTIVGSVVAAFLTGLFTFLGIRSKTKTNVQATLNSGFNSLIQELQEERRELQTERNEIQRKYDEMREMVLMQDKEIMDLTARVERLLKITTSFHNFIVNAGLVPPPFDKEDIIMGKNGD